MCTPFLFNGFPCEVNNSTSDEILDEQNKPICVDCVCNSHATIPPCCVDCKCEDSYASVQTTNNNRLRSIHYLYVVVMIYDSKYGPFFLLQRCLYLPTGIGIVVMFYVLLDFINLLNRFNTEVSKKSSDIYL